MQYFKDADDFMRLFSIEPTKPGCIDFAVLVELGAVMSRFPQYGCTVSDLARRGMRERGMSPLVYWSRMKRALRPILQSGPDALRALGIPIAPGSAITCPYLAGCLAEAIGAEYTREDLDELAELAAATARTCERAK